MLTYSFTNLKNESLYMHLYQCIRQDIVDGKLVSGEKLPSKRSFAKNLGVSTITIENAYAQLLSEGYIYSIPKKGFYVSDFKNNVIKPVRLTTENVKLSSGQSDFLADFSSNQTIRVLDQIANDIAVLFGKKYIGKVPNDAAGRIWNNFVECMYSRSRFLLEPEPNTYTDF